ncbi:MAG TPA: hypothetical protein VJT70_05790 [Sphingomicrobium sp.]|nr:hypothetical protein [Sphingomicrobium sp.]
MRNVRLMIGAALLACSAAAPATTIVVVVEPMTLERYTRIFDTPGPDRLLMCMAPPSIAGCTEFPISSRRAARR